MLLCWLALYPLSEHMEPALLITLIAAVGSFFTLMFDKMRKSRCVKIRSCCCEIERDLDDDDDEDTTSQDEPSQVPIAKT